MCRNAKTRMMEQDILEFFDDAFCNYGAMTLSTLQDMQKNGELCDLVIRVGNASFKVHRNILAAGIPYFRTMFNSNMVESFKKEIVMEAIDPTALECLINFAYTSKLKIARAKILSLLETSMYLQLDRVVDVCFKYLSKRINNDNALAIRAYADVTNNADVLENVNLYICENFNEISMTEEFVNLPLPALKEFICKNDLFVMSEEVVFEAVLNWVKALEEDRIPHLPELLGYVRLPLLNPEYLIQHVATEELIRTSTECTAILERGMNFHSLPDSSPFQERYCKKKFHLKCAKLMGCGMYAIFFRAYQNMYIEYYDHINRQWVTLYSHDGSGFMRLDYLFCTEEKIYFVAEGHLQSLNLRTLEWSCPGKTDNIPSGAGVVVYQDKVYFFGGLCNFTNRVHCLDLEHGTCLPAGKMVKDRISPSVVPAEECIYITGGFHNATFIKSAERYNPTSEHSTEIAPMHMGRCGHGCAFLNGKLYVYGGRINREFSDCFTSSGEVYDPLTNEWNYIKRKNKVLESDMSLVAYANKLYAIDCEPVDCEDFHVKVYDPTADKWKRGVPLPYSTYLQTTLVTGSASLPKGLEYYYFPQSSDEREELYSEDEDSDSYEEYSDDYSDIYSDYYCDYYGDWYDDDADDDDDDLFYDAIWY